MVEETNDFSPQEFDTALLIRSLFEEGLIKLNSNNTSLD
jgi:hypothetical protein